MFGYSYLLDLYRCKAGTCDSLELHYRLLEELVEILGMNKMSAPIVMHAQARYDNGHKIEIYPDKEGVSCWCPLIESGIQGHSIEPSHFSSWDIYSCKHFDKEIVKSFILEKFQTKDFEENFIIRGSRYNTDAEMKR